MLRAALLRCGQAALVAAAVVTLAFVLVHAAPGDPFSAALDYPGVTDAVRARWRAAFGLDAPLGEQYLRWWRALLRGDLGWSHSMGVPVRAVLARALPATALLVGTGLALGVALGVALGAWQAVRRGRAVDRAGALVTLALLSIPEFVVATLTLAFLALRWRLFPVGGMTTLDDGGLADRLRHLMLPAGVLALGVVPAVARVQRAALLGVLDEDFVRTARAKGAGGARVLWRHAWPASLAPVLALLGMLLPALAGGAVFIERVFAWPGMGSAVLDAVASRDYHLVLGGVLVVSLAVTVGNAAADLLAAWVDPRLRDDG